MTRDGLLLSEPVDLVLPEVAVEAAQALLVGIRQRRRLEQRPVGEGDEPLDLGLDASAVQTGLGEVVAERCDSRAVAPVEGAQRLDGEGVRGSQGSPPDRAPQFRGNVRGIMRLKRRAGSSWRNRPLVAVSIIASTESNIAASA